MSYIAFSLLFLLSRFLLINPQPVFFDSQEYLHLFAQSHFLPALALGHAPPHVGYIFLFWPIFQLFHSASAVLVFQALLSFMSILAFIKAVSLLSNKKTAFLAGIIAALLPLNWITSVSLMMEISYTAFFIFSLYFLVRRRLVLSALFFSLALLTHPLVLFWLPLYIYILFQISNFKFQIAQALAYLIVFYLSLSFLNILNISSVSGASFWPEFLRMYFSKFHEHAVLSFSLNGVLIFLRNFLLPLVFNNSVLLVLLAGLAILLRRRYSILLSLWILPAAFVNQWWDSLLNGRHALLAGFGLSFAVALLLSRRRFLRSVFLACLLAFSLPAAALLKGDIPYLQEAQAVASLPKDSLLIVSHFAKPQDEGVFPGALLAVNFPLTPTSEIKKAIDAALQDKHSVFITSTAISEPYGLYSGPYLHNLSLSYLHPFELSAILPGYTLQLIKTINAKDNMFISQIVSTASANLANPGYPSVPNLSKSPRLINSGDILMQQFYKLHPF